MSDNKFILTLMYAQHLSINFVTAWCETHLREWEEGRGGYRGTIPPNHVLRGLAVIAHVSNEVPSQSTLCVEISLTLPSRKLLNLAHQPRFLPCPRDDIPCP